MPRKARQTITKRHCESKPKARVFVHDDRCPGFFVSVTTKGVATFYFRYWNKTLKKQVPQQLGVYHATDYTIEKARAEAFHLKARVGAGEDIARTARQTRARNAKLTGVTVNALITQYLDYIKEEVPNAKCGGLIMPRVTTWKEYRGYFRRFVRPTLGHLIASEVTNNHIAAMIRDVRDGKVNAKYKGTASNARVTLEKTSAMFTWAAEAGRNIVLSSPCHNLPELEPKGERDRVLTDDEIRTLWWGLDRPDLPWPRSVALALKFQLCTMLRAAEFLKSTPDELVGLGSNDAEFHVPAQRVKARRPIVQPLSSLAQEVLAEAIESEDQPFIFPSDKGKAPHPRALGVAVNGKPPYRLKSGREVGGITGICEFLGMDKWTPHTLRRTAASLAYDLGFSELEIGYCLDHSNGKDGDKPRAARVTGIYARGGVIRRVPVKQVKKREILAAIDAELRRIIGEKPKLLPAPLLALPKAA